MPLMELLEQAGGLPAIARELGITEAQASSGAAALAPAVLGGLKKQAQAGPGGLAGLGGLLGQLGGGALLDDVLAERPTDTGRGNDVLAQIFGSKDVSRTVAHRAAATSGLDEGVLKKMLPLVAMVVTGYMARQGAGAPAAASGTGGLLGGLLGGGASAKTGGLLSMLDADGDGNPFDDILGMAGKLLR